jgi:hypothetical protein
VVQFHVLLAVESSAAGFGFASQLCNPFGGLCLEMKDYIQNRDSSCVWIAPHSYTSKNNIFQCIFYFKNTEIHYNITMYLIYVFLFFFSIKYIFVSSLYLHFIPYKNLSLNQIIKHKSY